MYIQLTRFSKLYVQIGKRYNHISTLTEKTQDLTSVALTSMICKI